MLYLDQREIYDPNPQLDHWLINDGWICIFVFFFCRNLYFHVLFFFFWSGGGGNFWARGSAVLVELEPWHAPASKGQIFNQFNCALGCHVLVRQLNRGSSVRGYTLRPKAPLLGVDVQKEAFLLISERSKKCWEKKDPKIKEK